MTKEKLISAIKDIPIIAEKDKWVFTLDSDEGSLFYAPTVIPSNSKLHQVTDEYAVYLNDKLVPQGVVVEYYKANFLKHHKVFTKVSGKLFESSNSNNKDVVVVDPKPSNEQATIFKALFETSLIKEAGNNIVC